MSMMTILSALKENIFKHTNTKHGNSKSIS